MSFSNRERMDFPEGGTREHLAKSPIDQREDPTKLKSADEMAAERDQSHASASPSIYIRRESRDKRPGPEIIASSPEKVTRVIEARPSPTQQPLPQDGPVSYEDPGSSPRPVIAEERRERITPPVSPGRNHITEITEQEAKPDSGPSSASEPQVQASISGEVKPREAESAAPEKEKEKRDSATETVSKSAQAHSPSESDPKQTDAAKAASTTSPPALASIPGSTEGVPSEKPKSPPLAVATASASGDNNAGVQATVASKQDSSAGNGREGASKTTEGHKSPPSSGNQSKPNAENGQSQDVRRQKSEANNNKAPRPRRQSIYNTGPMAGMHAVIASQGPGYFFAPPGSSPAGRGVRGPRMTSSARGRPRPPRREPFVPGNYKTEICRSFRTSGVCEYEGSCQFAHGVQELRPRQFGVKYKTQLCKNYHANGNCRFGSRCKFIHDEQRIQVTESEHWLVSPSENFVRVEIVDNPLRQFQLTALSDTQAAVAVAQANLTASPESRQATTTLGPIPLQNVAVPTVLVPSPSISPLTSTMVSTQVASPVVATAPTTPSTVSVSASTSVSVSATGGQSHSQQSGHGQQQQKSQRQIQDKFGQQQEQQVPSQAQSKLKNKSGLSGSSLPIPEGVTVVEGIRQVTDQLSMLAIKTQQSQPQNQNQNQQQKSSSNGPRSYAGVVEQQSQIKPSKQQAQQQQQQQQPSHNNHNKERQDRERRKSSSASSASPAVSATPTTGTSNAGSQQQQQQGGQQQMYVSSPLLASMPLLSSGSALQFGYSPLLPQRHLSQQLEQQQGGAAGSSGQQQHQQPLLSPITGLGILTEQQPNFGVGPSPILPTRGVATATTTTTADPTQMQMQQQNALQGLAAQQPRQPQQQQVSQPGMSAPSTSTQSQSSQEAMMAQQQPAQQPGSYMQYPGLPFLPFPYSATPQFMSMPSPQGSGMQAGAKQEGATSVQMVESEQLSQQQQEEIQQLMAQQALWQQQYASQFQPGLYAMPQQGQQQPGQMQPQQVMYPGLPYSPYQFSYGAQPAFQPQTGTSPVFFNNPSSEQYGTGSQQMQQQQPQSR